MKNQKNSLVSSLILVAFVLVASLVTLQAQQYYTNSTPPNGYPQGYSAGYSQPLAPSQTLGNQVADGIFSGQFNTGTNAAVTNLFSALFPATTNLYAAPAVYVQQINPTIGGLVGTNQVLFVTTTNCAVYFGGATNVNYSLTVIGH